MAESPSRPHHRLAWKIFLFFLVACASIVRLLKQQLVIFEVPEQDFDPAPRIRETFNSLGIGTPRTSKTQPLVIPLRLQEPMVASPEDSVDRSYYKEPIRNWGCNRKETPLIFVHIGKAGGGLIRARLAAAAQNYARGQKWKNAGSDNHYYPISETEKGYFCNRMFKNHRLLNSNIFYRSHEGFLPCNATTPIGMSLACPEVPKQRGVRSKCKGCNDPTASTCHTVYTGHLALGSELHWLPPRYLKTWWEGPRWQNFSSQSSTSAFLSWKKIQQGFQTLLPNNKRWCLKYQFSRPKDLEDSEEMYTRCSTLLSSQFDSEFAAYWNEHQRPSNTSVATTDYSSLYASLPLHRVTMLREPFSWLLSKYHWHKIRNLGHRCDDVSSGGIAWMQWYSIDYLVKLCGDDCANRLDIGLEGGISLEELERQAANNLRQSFSVVGILNETQTFYNMVTSRIHYVDMSLNPEVEGDVHSSVKIDTPETERCRKVYEDVEFRDMLKQHVPIVATIERLYRWAIKVNRHQMDELARCPSSQLSHR